MRLVKSTVFLVLIAVTAPAAALPEFLDEWRAVYPTSTADDFACQLCHQRPSGGSPWNAYGWNLREAYRDPLNNQTDFGLAVLQVENTDQDGDPLGATAVQEIEIGAQPGWREGSFNTFFSSNGDRLTNQPPPAGLPNSTILDFPTAIQDPISSPISTGLGVGLQEVAGGFNSPVKAVAAPGLSDKIFVVEQTGKIICVDLASGDKTTFYDVSSRLVDINPDYDERGLLGLAFHPDYQNNGLFYTYQSEPVRSSDTEFVDFSTQPNSEASNHRSFVVENFASGNGCAVSAQALNNVLIIDQPQSNHNGGDLAFDSSNNLYISLGDGGGRNDQGVGHGLNGNGRNNENVLGTILRINPLGSMPENDNYSVPSTNPFVGGLPGVEEIFAYGFRNPYRMSFDAQTGDLYTGDVGQGDIEEIDKVIAGGNYGWNWKEGNFFFYNPSSGSYISGVAPPNLPADLIDPVGEYDHDEGISITGGYVYRGTNIPSLVGKYVFGDFAGTDFNAASGRLFYLDLQTQVIREFAVCPSVPGYVIGFGQDANNELYVLTNDTINPAGVQGKLLKIVEPTSDVDLPPQCQVSDELCVPIRSAGGAVAVICL